MGDWKQEDSVRLSEAAVSHLEGCGGEKVMIKMVRTRGPATIRFFCCLQKTAGSLHSRTREVQIMGFWHPKLNIREDISLQLLGVDLTLD